MWLVMIMLSVTAFAEGGRYVYVYKENDTLQAGRDFAYSDYNLKTMTYDTDLSTQALSDTVIPGGSVAKWTFWGVDFISSGEYKIANSKIEKPYNGTISETEHSTILGTAEMIAVQLSVDQRYRITTQPTAANPTVVLNDSSKVSAYSWHLTTGDGGVGEQISGQNTATYTGPNGTVICKITFSDGASELVSNPVVINNITISFNANGGTGTMENVTIPANSTYILPSNGFTAPQSKTFAGWEIGTEQKQAGDTCSFSENTVIKALWTEITDVAAPVISSDSREFRVYTEVTITTATEGATIYYTTNGDTPTTSSKRYNGSFKVHESLTVKAVAVKSGVSSNVTSASFKLLNVGGATRIPVEFETNGGEKIAKKYVAWGDKLENITPKKEGAFFRAWYTDKKCTELYDFSTPVKKPLTLYAAWAEREDLIILTVGEKEAIVYGQKVTNDVAPMIKNNRVMLPTRFVAESLGANVKWEETAPDYGIVTITDNGVEIVIIIGEKTAYVNNKQVTLDSAAFISEDRTFTPIRFVAETLGYKVEWIEETQQVIIYRIN